MQKENITEILDSLYNGQFKQAKEFTLRGVKTKPMKLAHRVGQVVGALLGADGFTVRPDLAVRYLELFEE